VWYGVRNGGNGLAVGITVKTEKKGEEKGGEDYISRVYPKDDSIR